jgi:hypothetical protein
VSFDSEPPDVKNTAFKLPGANSASFAASLMAGSLLIEENEFVKASFDICSYAASASSFRPYPIFTFQSEDIPSSTFLPFVSVKYIPSPLEKINGAPLSCCCFKEEVG